MWTVESEVVWVREYWGVEDASERDGLGKRGVLVGVISWRGSVGGDQWEGISGRGSVGGDQWEGISGSDQWEGISGRGSVGGDQ